ncbi:MAG: hypothetical protein KDK78_02110 [Chlamydiia bacterium]|nr:hypothetical protein [Chlamydiia bacterium]
MHASENNESGETASHFAQWLESNGRLVAGIGILLAVFLVFGFRYYSGQRINSEHDYLSAVLSFEKIQRATTVDEAALQSLQGLIATHPELKAKYEGALTQELIKGGDFSAADRLGTDVLQRLGDDLAKPYAAFSHASLALCREDTERALSMAQGLAQRLDEGKVDEQTLALHTYNLIRIAMLQQALEKKNEELAAWAAVQTWISLVQNTGSPKSQQLMSAVLRTLQEGSVSLEAYIEHRRQRLTT